jgi:hypothetical protein
MLTLHIVGASDEEIIADYVLSDSAYRDIKDSKAMVVAMKQVCISISHFYFNSIKINVKRFILKNICFLL